MPFGGFDFLEALTLESGRLPRLHVSVSSLAQWGSQRPLSQRQQEWLVRRSVKSLTRCLVYI